MAMITRGAKIELTVEDGATPQQLGVAMEPEIAAFQAWFRSKGNEPLLAAEKAILKTYIAWKLLYQEQG